VNTTLPRAAWSQVLENCSPSSHRRCVRRVWWWQALQPSSQTDTMTLLRAAWPRRKQEWVWPRIPHNAGVKRTLRQTTFIRLIAALAKNCTPI